MLKGKRLDWWILAAFAIGYFYIPKFWPSVPHFQRALARSDRAVLIGSFVWRNSHSVAVEFSVHGVVTVRRGLVSRHAEIRDRLLRLPELAVFFVAYVPVASVIKYRDCPTACTCTLAAQAIGGVVFPSGLDSHVTGLGDLISLALALLSWELLEKHALNSRIASRRRATTWRVC